MSHTISVCVETFIEFITQSDSRMTNFLEWNTQVAISTSGSRFLVATKDDPAFGNTCSESRHDYGDDSAAGGV